ncbi:small subunit (SSU) processome component [Aspergillus puulaauensis]|uniref:Small subunit (SSU) processome component n=1 Tax=Aspergillus puulaauensis TaxID=1220207 RepID=A0A7R7XFU5_9EURO|nr:small subunit (SSU) processome component [Aspergillus puulaauensis]BCS20641.1 small subunit (SSU) processome component [Aspergillus puulaauensis]
MGKKSSQKPASKTSSAAAFAVADATNTGNKSSMLKASFAPSDYQLALFASVIHGLEGQNLRIHDTNTGRLQCEHVLGPKELVTSLDWGHHAGRRDQSKKKRKRPSDVNGAADGLDQSDVVVAFGTNTSDIRMYSPAEDKIVGTLAGGHTGGIRDFKFTADRPQEGWSIGGDNKLVQWDLATGQTTRVINLSTTSTFTTLSRPVSSNPPVICASQSPSIINLEDESPVTFPAMRNSIQSIITSSASSVSDGLFLASDNDRYINVFDPTTGQLTLNLVAEREVSSLSLYSKQSANGSLALEKQVLAAVTQDGTVELFARPFVRPQGSKGNSLKARSMQMTRRAETSIKITKSTTSDSLVPVVSVSFQGPELIIAWAHGGIVPLFERVRWLNEETDELAFTGVKNIAKTKSSSILQSVTTNGAKNANESHVNENRVVVEQGNLADDDIDMEDSKNDVVSEDDSGVDSDDDDGPKKQKPKATQDNEEAESDEEMQNVAGSGVEDEDGDDEETGEPTFGELMRAHAAEEIDVEAELEDDVHTRSLIPGKPITTVQQIPSGVSLATVLSQSLKTNDNDMLEACFHTGDAGTIRTTIQRLDSPLAATLLQRLAERLSSRPGRYGHLLVWVQWTCIAHGGALAGNKELLKQMSTLFKVMDQRSSTLSSLLLLKGKLDMLDAQLVLRQSLRENADHMDSEDEENVIYVEGYDDEEDEDSDAEATKNIDTPRTKAIRDQTDISMIDEDEEGSEDDDEEDEEVDEEGPGNILDVEAEESAGSSDAEESLDEDEDEVEDSDADSAASMADFIADTEDDDSDAEALSRPPPSKKARLSQGGGKGKNKAGSGRK